jgi:hypothetical protein
MMLFTNFPITNFGDYHCIDPFHYLIILLIVLEQLTINLIAKLLLPPPLYYNHLPLTDTLHWSKTCAKFDAVTQRAKPSNKGIKETVTVGQFMSVNVGPEDIAGTGAALGGDCCTITVGGVDAPIEPMAGGAPEAIGGTSKTKIEKNNVVMGGGNADTELNDASMGTKVATKHNGHGVVRDSSLLSSTVVCEVSVYTATLHYDSAEMSFEPAGTRIKMKMFTNQNETREMIHEQNNSRIIAAISYILAKRDSAASSTVNATKIMDKMSIPSMLVVAVVGIFILILLITHGSRNMPCMHNVESTILPTPSAMQFILILTGIDTIFTCWVKILEKRVFKRVFKSKSINQNQNHGRSVGKRRNIL